MACLMRIKRGHSWGGSETTLLPGFGGIRGVAVSRNLQRWQEVLQVWQRFLQPRAAIQVQRLEVGQLANGFRQPRQVQAVIQVQRLEV